MTYFFKNFILMNKKDYYQKKLEDLNQEERIFHRPDLPNDPKKFHIVGICGTAMGSLSGLLKDKKYEVSGSDQACFPPISDMLEKIEAKIFTGNYEGNRIKELNPDVVVIGNVSTPNNPEAKFARENNLPQAVLPEVLAKYVFNDAKRIVVSGTHGKTTTTGLVKKIFEAANKNPGFMIGGVPQGSDKSFALGDGDYAIFEGDEYDTSYFNKMPKFLQYGAHTGIITSIELDHLDIYSDFEDYKKAFEFFVEEIPEEGFLFINGDHDVTKELSQKENIKCNLFTYGLENSNDIYAENILINNEDRTQNFDVIYKKENLGSVTINLSGSYNVSNCIVAIGVALSHGISFEDCRKGLGSFHGMKRRQEVFYDDNGLIFIDDFAHHPTSVKETLEGLNKKYSNRKGKLIALFEPRSNSSRKKVFEEAYTKSFDSADEVHIKMPPFRENDNKEDFIDVEFLTNSIREKDIEAFHHSNVEDLLNSVSNNIKEGDVVVMMSNGNFDGLKEKLIEKTVDL